MTKRLLRIHGDNIIECERSLKLISHALGTAAQYISDSPIYMPMYKLGDIEIVLLSGHSRWGVSVADAMEKHGGILREGADSYITEVVNKQERILFAVEYCSALPAGNNAWQRNGRAMSSILAGVPYLYLAEICGVELDTDRNIKAPRFPNPIVPFSYLMAGKRYNSLCLPIYAAHPSITDALYKKYSNIFGVNECLLLIEALINNKSTTPIANVLVEKAINLVKLLSNERRLADTLRENEWIDFYNSLNTVNWLEKNTTHLVWKKKIAQKVRTTTTFEKLFAKVLSYKCTTIGAKDMPICIIPTNKRSDFVSYLKKQYPSQTISFEAEKPIAVVWITGFKPHGDDSRPDRGLSPLAKMILGNDAQLLAVVSGPAKTATWQAFKSFPKDVAKENGLWQAILNICDYVLVDSTTCRGKVFYKTNANLSKNTTPVSFTYKNPVVTFGEHDTDTSIHQLFSRRKNWGIFESLCNPPGGDWSGINYSASAKDEYRWTSLPRVSKIGGKRPDNVIQLKGKEQDIFLSIESKLNGKDLETNIGTKLKSYLTDLFNSIPTAHKSKSKDWRLYEGKPIKMSRYTIISIGAFAFIDKTDLQIQLKRGNLDAVFGFEFGKVTTLHVLTTAKYKTIEDVLKQAQLGLDGLKIKIY